MNYKITTVKDIALTRAIYNLNYKGALVVDFDLPNWCQRNVELNEVYLAKYGIEKGTDYDDIPEETKEKIRDEVFDSWVEGTWRLIRTIIGYKIDKIGYERLTNNQKEEIKIALAEQVNYWRTNLPYEVSSATSKVAGDYSISIDATQWLTGYDSLSALTKTHIRATGLLTIDYDQIPELSEEEKTIADLQRRVFELETKGLTATIPSNLITRTEVVNNYLPSSTPILSKPEADQLYFPKEEGENILNNAAAPALFTDELNINEQRNFVHELGDTRKIKLEFNAALLNFSYYYNDQRVHGLEMGADGVFVYRSGIGRTEILTRSNLSNYLDKTAAGQVINGVVTFRQLPRFDNPKTPTNDEDIIDFKYVKDTYYDKDYIDNHFHTTVNTYTKSEVDQKITDVADDYYPKTNTYTRAEVDAKLATAITSGTIDLSDYWNEAKLKSNFYLKGDVYTKHECDVRFSTNPLVRNEEGSTSDYEAIGRLFKGEQYYGPQAKGDQYYGRNAEGDQFYGFHAEGEQYYGKQAQNHIHFGFQTEKDIFIGEACKGKIEIGSATADRATNDKIIYGDREVTFEKLIHNTNLKQLLQETKDDLHVAQTVDWGHVTKTSATDKATFSKTISIDYTKINGKEILPNTTIINEGETVGYVSTTKLVNISNVTSTATHQVITFEIIAYHIPYLGSRTQDTWNVDLTSINLTGDVATVPEFIDKLIEKLK